MKPTGIHFEWLRPAKVINDSNNQYRVSFLNAKNETISQYYLDAWAELFVHFGTHVAHHTRIKKI